MEHQDLITLNNELFGSVPDLLLVSDGSGNFRTTSCGWCCVAFQPHLELVEVHIGGANGGTNNFAELSPFLHALWSHDAARRSKNEPFKSIRVHCVSDSEVTVKCAAGAYEMRANASLWASLSWFEENGYSFRWKHVPRNSNPVNTHCDRLAGKVREAIEEFGGLSR